MSLPPTRLAAIKKTIGNKLGGNEEDCQQQAWQHRRRLPTTRLVANRTHQCRLQGRQQATVLEKTWTLLQATRPAELGKDIGSEIDAN